MSSINDYRDDKVRKSRNLAGLYAHARRIAKRAALPLCMTVRQVEVTPIAVGSYRAHVVVYYAGAGHPWAASKGEKGDVGQTCFADLSIARDWARTFATKRGGSVLLHEGLPDQGQYANS